MDWTGSRAVPREFSISQFAITKRVQPFSSRPAHSSIFHYRLPGSKDVMNCGQIHHRRSTPASPEAANHGGENRWFHGRTSSHLRMPPPPVLSMGTSQRSMTRALSPDANHRPISPGHSRDGSLNDSQEWIVCIIDEVLDLLDEDKRHVR